MSNNERREALYALLKVVQKNISISSIQEPLSPYSRQLVYGVCRHYFYLEHIAHSLITKKPKEIEIWIIILLGLYQLHFLKQAEYAVVKETVNLTKKAWAKGFINAVLRNYCRQANQLSQNIKTGVYNHPDWFVTRIQQAWPENWQAILIANDQHPPMTLRINTAKISVEAYLQQLNQVGIQSHRVPFAPQALRLETPCDVKQLPGFNQGLCAVQDAAAQLAADLLELKPGLRVLDACAAPGGKTCHILEKMPQLKNCIAIDVDEQRMKRVKDNLQRLGHHATLCVGDATNPHTWWDGVPFDRILLDAPCSATGVIRRHPDIKLTRTESDIAYIPYSAVKSRIKFPVWFAQAV